MLISLADIFETSSTIFKSKFFKYQLFNDAGNGTDKFIIKYLQFNIFDSKLSCYHNHFFTILF